MRILNRLHLPFVAVVMLLAANAVSFAHPMWGIAVDKAGQVYFSDLTTVWRIDAGGRLSVFRPKGEGHVHEISLDADGNLFGAENTYDPATKKFFSAIWKMTPAGDSSYVVPLQEVPPNGTSIWRDGDGNEIYLTEFPVGKLLVLKRTPGGQVSPLVGDEQAVRDFRQSVPYGISPVAFGTDGTFYFTHGANVNKITRDGRLTRIARNVSKEAPAGKHAVTSLYGIAIDAQGNPIVADYGNRRVFRLALADNRLTTLVRSEGLWYPTGVAVRGEDTYVLEVGHTPSHVPVGTRVIKLSSGGAVTVLATVNQDSATNAAVLSSSKGEAPSKGIDEPSKASALTKGPYYLIFAIGAVFSIVLSIVLWKGRQRM